VGKDGVKEVKKVTGVTKAEWLIGLIECGTGNTECGNVPSY
jgi:hypothetical protein